MATIYRCDKCERDHLEEAKVRRVMVPRVGVQNANEFYDLCDRCLQRLHDWLVEPEPKVGQR
jgi:hypothetical protein